MSTGSSNTEMAHRQMPHCRHTHTHTHTHTHINSHKTGFQEKPYRVGMLRRHDRPTCASPSSPGVRQLSVGEVRVRVRGERGVRGEGSVSQALQPLGGGAGMDTPER